FTMFFNGGMIPTFLLVKDLGLYNTRWALILPGAMAVWFVIIAKTYIQTNIHDSLHESAKLDGCDDFRFFVKIVLPLCKPILAVLALYYGVGHWNEFFSALIYLRSSELYPLQIILRDILVLNQFDYTMTMNVEEAVQKELLAELLKYSLIVVSTLPVVIVYPFVQKYFVKGVMIGAIKG
ncbi:MAG: carbohydrate ABC transporter permease, partial [Proteobacteria bacterium]|nr:carbohydrate ABC transporter permease [Pseudomonadota bacterium]